MRRILALLTLLLVPGIITANNAVVHRSIPRTFVDGYAQINHFHDDQGVPIFDQIIFFEWNNFKSRHEVLAWVLLKNSRENINEERRAPFEARVKAEVMKAMGWDKWPEGEKVPELRKWQWPTNLKIYEKPYGTIYVLEKDGNTFEVVTTCKVKETWTQHDPELTEREHLEKEKRKGIQEKLDGPLTELKH